MGYRAARRTSRSRPRTAGTGSSPAKATTPSRAPKATTGCSARRGTTPSRAAPAGTGFLGGEGNDYLDGGSGNDRIYGGEGDDTNLGGEGNDWIRGDAGDDSITGGAGNDTIGGNAGNDTIDGGAGNDYLYGGEGDDVIYGGTGEDRIDGGEGDDILRGAADNDTDTDVDTFVFEEGHGDDTIADFTDGTDLIDLSDLGIRNFAALTIADDANGNAVITTSTGNTITLTGVATANLDASNFLFDTTGTSGNDTITDFADGTDLIDLGALDGVMQFNDMSIADDTNGNAVITTSAGNTITLTGVSTSDLDASNFLFDTWGTSGNDTIDGSVVDDTIAGYGGDDSLTGRAGDDLISGGEGNDSLTGGTGTDTFVFGTGHGNDTITDFTDDWDCIDLSGITSVTQLSDLTFTPNDDGVVINTGEGTILLEGVDLGELDEEDFVFYEPPVDDNM